ncbi:MAG TPA: hypothetical protein VHT26_07640 [Trebonia sp.]|jgi:hypothetical protein|nr:hypothetical protein [Trebonia sp.]
MRDSAAIDQIDPASVDLIGYYVDGRYVPTASQLARFAGKVHVPISVDSRGNLGVVGDGPPDNGAWPDWVNWVVRRRQAGVDPTMYTNLSSWPAAIQYFNRANVAQPHWWIAEWNGRAEMIGGAVAHQYQEVVNRWDDSVVADYWPGIDPVHTKPAPPPTPAPPAPPPGPTPAQIALALAETFEEDDMIMVHDPSGAISLVSGSLYVHIPDISDVTAFEGAGVKQINISQALSDGLKAGSAALQGKLSGTLAISGQLQAS